MHRLSLWLTVLAIGVGLFTISQPVQAGICVYTPVAASQASRPGCVDGEQIDEETCSKKCTTQDHLLGRTPAVGKNCQHKSSGTCAEFYKQLGNFQQTQKTLNDEYQQTSNAPFPDVESLNRVGAGTTPQELIGRAINIIVQIMGTIALIILVYAGVTWMTAAGNADREHKALQMMFWGGLGVIVILSGYAIVKFILDHTFL